MGFKLLAEVGGQGERLEQYRQYKPPDSNCSHTQMSVLARRIMAQILVHTTDLDLTPLRHIALDLAPSPEIAKLLLSSSSSSHSAPLPPGFLRHLLLLAAREGWPGLGSPALTALHLMPPDQQAAELSAGGGGALCSLLLLDAPAILSGAVGPSLRERSLLSPLLGFLQSHVDVDVAPPPSSSGDAMQLHRVEGVRAAASSARLVFSRAEWRGVVLKVCW